MAIKLHTCGNTWIHGMHPCWKVMHALDEAGVEYEQVKEPTFPRGKRSRVKELTGQDRLPVIEYADGTGLREESKDLIARIRSGNLGETAPKAAPASV